MNFGLRPEDLLYIEKVFRQFSKIKEVKILSLLNDTGPLPYKVDLLI